MIGFALNTGVAAALNEPFMAIGERLSSRIVRPLRFTDLAWFALAVLVGWHALRQRLAQAGGDLLMSVVLTGLCGVLLANTTGYLNGALDTTGKFRRHPETGRPTSGRQTAHR